jgi:preprotein translocase subunit SecE
VSDSTAATGPGGSALVGRKRDGGPGLFRSIPVFIRQVAAELRKVVWPGRQDLITYTTVVIVFVVIMTSLVALLDFGFSQAVVHVFGNG